MWHGPGELVEAILGKRHASLWIQRRSYNDERRRLVSGDYAIDNSGTDDLVWDSATTGVSEADTMLDNLRNNDELRKEIRKLFEEADE